MRASGRSPGRAARSTFRLLAAAALTTLMVLPAAGARAVTPEAAWPMWQRDLAGSRFNADESAIGPGTVGRLELKWAHAYEHLPSTRMGSQPAVVDGVLYVGAPDGKFLALDAKSGATKWTFDLSTVTGPPGEAPNSVRDGAAVAGDLVYFGDSTGRVYALHTRDGSLAWATRVSDHPASRMTSSPLVFEGRVYIGVAAHEGGTDPNEPCCSHRGQVVALDAHTGEMSWRYHTVPPAKKVGTWPSGADKFAPSGGGVWSSPVADPATRTVYIGTGNNYTGQAGDIDSVLALDAGTGTPRWKQRLTFPDEHTGMCALPDPGPYCPGKGSHALNYDVGATPNVLSVDGRTIVTVGQKGGAFHAFDARSGAVLWRTQLAVPPADSPEPGSYGVEWGSFYDGQWLYAATWWGEPATIFKIDPVDGRVVAKIPHPADGCETGGAAAFPDVCQEAFTPAVSGTRGLVYEGSADGKIRIFSSKDGRQLWEFDTIRDFQGVNGKPGRGGSVSGNGGAVVVNGMLYVQSGYFPFYPSDKGTVLLAFGLGE